MSTTAAPGEFRGTGKDILASSDALALRLIQTLASLKLTCVLFLLAMVIVFVGSLAQSRRDVWQVMAEYFRCYVAWIDLQDLFPPSMFGNYGAEVAKAAGALRYIPFPGGWTIGWLLLSNLIAAHALKFKVRATGMRLAAGLAFIVVGLLMMWLIVYTGNQQTGVEAANWLLEPTAIWYLMLSILGLAGISTIFAGCLNKKNGTTARAVIILVGAVLTGVFLYYVLGGEKTRLNLSSMRILWQLLKGTACSIVLLIGSNLLFEKRGGIALLHFGVAMLMISELQVGLVAKENMVMLTEGETTTFARDVRERELAILFRKESGEEDWVTISEKKLIEASRAAGPASEKAETSFAKPGGEVTPGQIISLADLQSLQLPFDVAVRSFVRNSTLRGKQPGEEAELAKGLSSFATVDEVPPVNGMDSQQDESSVFVDVIDRASGKILASLLVSQNVSEMQAPGLAEKVSVADKDYYFYLRFQRNYKPYEVKLIDVSRKNYVGTATPRDYRSEIEITEDGSTEKFTLWMNNPLRYKGETFYQSGYTPLENGKEATTLSVVRNSGWMLPYIACMIVSVGMFAQFGQTLLRFLDRSDRRVPKAATGDADEDSATPTATFRPGFAPIAPKEVLESPEPKAGWMAAFGIPAMVTLIFAVWVIRGMAPPKPVENAMNLYRFAQLPIAWNGRAQPVDSLARTQLMLISSKSTFEAELEPWQLSNDKVRETIIKSVQSAWPKANVEELKTLKGTYSEWIAKVIGLTEAEPEAVEARLRPLMVRKAPAVHWLLDVMTRPEVAARHRVLKIEDDKILSLLGLPKRGGLTYSIAEVRENLDDLENIMRNALAKKNAKTEVLDVTEGRVLTLFDNLRRINQLADVFGVQETDNALDSAITSWRILRALGNEPAVMAVPTGYDEDEQRSWETYVAASAVSTMNEQMAAQEISNYEQFAEYLKNKRPLELVRRSVIGSYGILLSTAKETASEGSPGESVRKAAEDGLKRVDDIYLRNILTILAKADTKKTPEEIANEITLEQAQSVAAERISSDLFQVISLLMEESPNDKRLTQIRSRLQALGTEDSPALTAAMNEELGRLVWDDLQARVGQLMPGGKASASFTASAKSVTAILDAWKKADVGLFNESVTAYQTALKEKPLPHVDAKRVAVEAWFNYFEPFYKTEFIYLPILILTFVGWLLPLNGSFRKTSLFLLVFGLLLHTLALGLRMWISGRPPVTNLYSSAIFIGWAVVIMAMIVELILKNGIGNLVGAASGAGTLMIAHYLARDDGDTLGVMQAVLDTAFWLATHVVCITLGYAATFLAGFLGLGYLGLCVAEKFTGPLINKSTNTSMRVLTGRMVYGVLCFALFFSLVGTVLGGLWADDSWGRFWGWDPKENGAMLIVIWNALILHARWDKMVGDYGTAVLAMLGNIVTAWSWFGVNELGAGLHAYGFTEGRLYALFVFVVIQAWVVVGFTVFARSLAKPVNASAAG